MPHILDIHLLVTGKEHEFITGESMVEKVNLNFPWNNLLVIKNELVNNENIM